MKEIKMFNNGMVLYYSGEDAIGMGVVILGVPGFAYFFFSHQMDLTDYTL